MTKSTTHRIALDRLATALQPDVTQPQMVLAWNLVEQLLRELNLDPKSANDCKLLASVLCLRFFDEGKARGRPAWSESQLCELLFEVQKHKQKNPRLSDQRACELIARDKDSPTYFRAGLHYTAGKGQGLIKRLRDARHHFQSNALARAAFPLVFGRRRPR